MTRTTHLWAGCVGLRELTGDSVLGRRPGKRYTHQNLMIRDPVFFEGGVFVEKGCLPRILYQFPCEQFPVVDRGNVAIEIETVVDLVKPP